MSGHEVKSEVGFGNCTDMGAIHEDLGHVVKTEVGFCIDRHGGVQGDLGHVRS